MENNIPQGCRPFDLEAALNKNPVVTRNGTVVEDLHHFTTSKVDYPVYGVIAGAVCKWTIYGDYYHDSDESSERDIFMVAKPVEKYCQVGLEDIGILCESKEEAIELSHGLHPQSICKLTLLNGEVIKAETVHRY